MITAEYIRDPAHIRSVLKQEGVKLLAKVPLIVQFPQRFLDADMADISATTSVYGLYIIIDPNAKKYSLVNIPNLIEMEPYRHDREKVHDETYVNLYFEPGDAVVSSTNILARDTYLYPMVNEFLFKAKIPYYVEYEDITRILANTKKFTKVDLYKEPVIIELVTSILARDPKDLKLRVRNFKTDQKPNRNDIEYIGIDNVFYGMDNTVSKLVGNYFEDAVVSALVTTSTKSSKVEKILKA